MIYASLAEIKLFIIQNQHRMNGNTLEDLAAFLYFEPFQVEVVGNENQIRVLGASRFN
jgi:hypothetical protein